VGVRCLVHVLAGRSFLSDWQSRSFAQGSDDVVLDCLNSACSRIFRLHMAGALPLGAKSNLAYIVNDVRHGILHGLKRQAFWSL
jgi:hypothetical protein